MRLVWLLAALAALGGTGRADAAFVVDVSPLTTGRTGPTGASNTHGGQHFADSFTLAGDTTLTAADTFGTAGWATPGVSVTIDIFADNGGTLGSLLNSLTTTLTTVDSQFVGAEPSAVRVHAELAAPVTLAAGTYWVSISGTTQDITQDFLKSPTPPGDGKVEQFPGFGLPPSLNTFVGDMAYQLEGGPAAVAAPAPAPAGLLLALTGAGPLGLVGWLRRRRAA